MYSLPKRTCLGNEARFTKPGLSFPATLEVHAHHRAAPSCATKKQGYFYSQNLLLTIPFTCSTQCWEQGCCKGARNSSAWTSIARLFEAQMSLFLCVLICWGNRIFPRVKVIPFPRVQMKAQPEKPISWGCSADVQQDIDERAYRGPSWKWCPDYKKEQLIGWWYLLHSGWIRKQGALGEVFICAPPGSALSAAALFSSSCTAVSLRSSDWMTRPWSWVSS